MMALIWLCNRSQEDSAVNPNEAEDLAPSPFKRVRYSPNPNPSPNPIQAASGSQSAADLVEEVAPLETNHVNVLGNSENEVQPEESQDELWSDLNNMQNAEEESTDPTEESINDVTLVEQPIDLEAIVNRFIMDQARAESSFDDSSSGRTLHRTSPCSDISVSIDPEEIAEVTVQKKTSPKTKKTSCNLM